MNISFASTSTITSSTLNSYYNPNIFFFLQNFPAFVGTQGVIILLIIALGALVYLFYKFICVQKKKLNLDDNIIHEFDYSF